MLKAAHKPTLRYLCTCYGVEPPMLMRVCSLSPSIIWAVYFDYMTTEQVAAQVLAAFNALKGTSYTLDDIAVAPGETGVEKG